MTLALSMVSSLLVGGILAVAPWTPLWDQNSLLQASSLWRSVALHPYMRGAVTGLGLVNITLALHELYELLSSARERPR